MSSNKVRSIPSYLPVGGYKVWNHPSNDLIIPKKFEIKRTIKDEPLTEEETSISNNHSVNLSNPYLRTLEVDRLPHLGIVKEGNNLERKFGDIKFVCTGESVKRMERAAYLMKKQLNLDGPVELIDSDRDRFSIYKIGPILCVNHGIGVPSLTVLLNEIFKLLAYAKCENVVIFRLGTCGSIGKPIGSIILTNKAVDDRQRPIFEQVVLGKVVALDAKIDHGLVQELKMIGDSELSDYNISVGTTMATNDFYEGQGRITGAFCEHTSAERNRHLLALKKSGIISIEMEANAFHALCSKAKIRAATIDVVTSDRLQGDMINDDTDNKCAMVELRPAALAAKYIQKYLH